MKALQLVLLSLCMLNIKAQTNLTIRVVFPFQPSEVTYMGFWPTITLPMANTGPNEYSISTNTDANGSLLFNIRYKLPVYGNYHWWVAGGNRYSDSLVPARLDAHGLKYARVYVNNELISDLYTTKNADGSGFNISLKLGPLGQVSPNPLNAQQAHLPTDDRIPNEAPHHKAFRNTKVPYSTDNKVLGWIIALSDNELVDSCLVQIDWLRVYGFNGNDSVLLCEHQYNSFHSVNDGGLYLRYPFFPPGFDYPEPFQGTVNNGILSFYPSDKRKRVWHLWTNNYLSPQGFSFSGYKVVSRARIVGHALMQLGIDFRNSANQVHELGVSDWYFHNNGQWQLMTFDSRNIITQMEPESRLTEVQVRLDSSTGTIHIEYKGMNKGAYSLDLYNSAGQLISGFDVDFEDHSGKIQLPVRLGYHAILYRMTGPSGSRGGKVQYF